MTTIQRFRAAALAALLLSSGLAAAEESRLVVTNDAWKAECGSCHLAYPPQLLPAASWAALFASLDDHFGVDATLDPATAAQLLDYAQTHAARAAGGTPTLRITETRWFRHEHDEIGAATWNKPTVGSAANCAACHRGAEQGAFDENAIRIPR
ncbi:diheme cytochrome c [Fontimonas sp. SYSU GA230001]|uniref:diheme cytochrome c n=1 Tax=Fontimonas sp. SYSU GA230001 TaxID=3142450 RepID=UPI0032B58711